MLEIKSDKSIAYPKGDKFELNALLVGYQHIPGNTYFLSVKIGGDVMLTLQAEATATAEGLNLHFYATSEQMKILTPRRYIYDVHIVNTAQNNTVMFTANFEVREVAHYVF